MYMPTPLSEMNAAELDRYVIELCDSIKAAIEARGVTVGSAAVAEYSGLIRQIVGFLEAKTVSPSTSQQIIEASQGYDGLSSVTVGAVTSSIDTNITEGNIKSGVEILGVTGSYSGEAPNLESKSVSPSTSQQIIEASQGYDGLSSVAVGAVTSSIDMNITEGNIKKNVAILGVVGSFEGDSPTLQDKTVSPSGSTFTVYPDAGYDGLSSVEIGGVTLQDKSVAPSSSQQVITCDSGYTGLDEVTISAVDASIDSSIQSQNIKAGITILDVVGSYTGGGGGSASQYVNTHPTKLTYAYSEYNGTQNDLWNLGSIPELDTSAVTTMNNCFRSNSQVTVLDLSTWSFASCTNTQFMFAACGNLTKVTFPVNTPLRNIGSMFNNCTSLEEIAGSLNLSNCKPITEGVNIFYGCTSLKKIQISDFSYNTDQTLDFSASTVFDAEYLLNSLPAYTGSYTKTIKVNSAVISQQLIDDYAAKGYTLTS
jgi:hypothetical protein